MGYWLGTLIFFIIQVIVTVCINVFDKKPSHGLSHTLAITAVVQCWFLWSIVYMAQMHPLIQPGNK
ncbi:vacuolar ATPase subunit E-like protein [Scenedesmus sp. NREL 46B-D3]|nr:vacuolar ATPase subunit E-like protein [Scenedesmus sp. NREL 46B-D3]